MLYIHFVLKLKIKNNPFLTIYSIFLTIKSHISFRFFIYFLFYLYLSIISLMLSFAFRLYMFALELSLIYNIYNFISYQYIYIYINRSECVCVCDVVLLSIAADPSFVYHTVHSRNIVVFGSPSLLAIYIYICFGNIR